MTKKANLFHATFEQVLIYVDEPQLVLFSSVDNTKVIGIAVPEWESFTYPFFAVHVSDNQFHEYLNEKFDLRYLLLKPSQRKSFIFDLEEIDENGEIQLTILKKPQEHFDEFLPEPGLFARAHTEEVSAPAKNVQSVYQFNVDGSWDLPEFSGFYKGVTDLYSLFSHIESFIAPTSLDDVKQQIRNAFINPFEGGGSYLSLYNSLNRLLPPQDKLAVSGITYNSPGHIKIRGSEVSFSNIKSFLDNYENNAIEIKDAYKILYKTLKQNKMLRMKSSDFLPNSETLNTIREQSHVLANKLNIATYEHILDMSDGNALIAAKVLLSIHRRAENIQEYFLEGRVEFS